MVVQTRIQAFRIGSSRPFDIMPIGHKARRHFIISCQPLLSTHDHQWHPAKTQKIFDCSSTTLNCPISEDRLY